MFYTLFPLFSCKNNLTVIFKHRSAGAIVFFLLLFCFDIFMLDKHYSYCYLLSNCLTSIRPPTSWSLTGTTSCPAVGTNGRTKSRRTCHSFLTVGRSRPRRHLPRWWPSTAATASVSPLLPPVTGPHMTPGAAEKR